MNIYDLKLLIENLYITQSVLNPLTHIFSFLTVGFIPFPQHRLTVLYRHALKSTDEAVFI